MPSRAELEQIAKLLEDSGEYRLLRRIPSDLGLNRSGGDLPHFGIVLDTETTGLDPEINEVIELGMIKFSFGSDGQIGPVCARFQAFQEPSAPLSEDIQRLTGLSAADLSGQNINLDATRDFVRGVALVIAHNAAFDRPFVEKLSTAFAELPWACSASQLDWQSEGIGGYRLEYILNHFGYFHLAHRAVTDCEALLFILSQPFARLQRTAFDLLLEAARRPVARIFAEGAPFESRRALKLRGYRWNDGQNGFPRAWWRDVDPDLVDAELAYLRDQAGWRELQPRVFRMTARNRFRPLSLA